MLVYDITNEKSFENIQNWIRNIDEVRQKNKSSMFLFTITFNVFCVRWTTAVQCHVITYS